MPAQHNGKRLLLLATKTGYQTRAFAEAARRLSVEVVYGTDRCHVLEDPWGDRALPLRFEDPEASSQQITEFARGTRLDAIIALGDRPTATAARAAAALGLPWHTAAAADICCNKYLSREQLRRAGIAVPRFCRFPLDFDFAALMRSQPAFLAEFPVGFPCVLKPVALSGSRGVIRADTPAEAAAAFQRIRALLRAPDVQVLHEDALGFIQAEEYVDGIEVAVEGMVESGQLHVLAVFDKPDLLVGPYFEETIYVTPSRLGEDLQRQIVDVLKQAVSALRLSQGPVHAELRLAPLPKSGSFCVVILEVAARCIGGLCARALRFTSADSAQLCGLEELIIRAALGESVSALRRETQASGVMMIPIPSAGIYEDVAGMEAALALPGIDEIRITAKPGQKLVPLPEGASYLGFIFARSGSPEAVEAALRAAHQQLRFVIAPALPLVGAR